VRGTRYFFSPEMVKSGMQEVPSNIWAVGCTVLMMLTGEPPSVAEPHTKVGGGQGPPKFKKIIL